MSIIINLTKPQFGSQYIQEKIICVRAHRERIFRVEPEHYRDKIIFHNYGHGGTGWTFLFGSVDKSIEQFKNMQHLYDIKPSVCVIGAGCYGLLTAIHLARNGYSVSIIAAEQTKQLPSHKAAGFFFPRHRRTSTPQEKKEFLEIGIHSYKTYRAIATGNHPFIPDGPTIIPAYYGNNNNPGFDEYIKQDLMPTPKPVTISFGTTQHNVMYYQTVFINPAQIMMHLENLITQYEIPIIQQTITDFSELQEQYIFNCAGLGAKQLTGDKKIVPVQGHLITLKNQRDIHALQYMINVKVPVIDRNGIPRHQLLYYAPKDPGILGITFLRGKRSQVPNHHEFDLLIERCNTFFGS